MRSCGDVAKIHLKIDNFDANNKNVATFPYIVEARASRKSFPSFRHELWMATVKSPITCEH